MTFKMYLACLSADLASFSVGMSAAWTSPIIPRLRMFTADSPLRSMVDSNEDGWISSFLSIGATFGSPLAGPLANRIGRKLTLLIGGVLFAASYSIFIVADSIWYLYIGRLLQGIASGFTCTVIPIYTSEVTTNKSRGPFGSVISFFCIAGVLYVYVLGAMVRYLTLQIYCLVVPILFLGTFIFMPETPYFYAMKKRKSDVGRSLKFLGRYGEDIEDEIEKIQTSVDSVMENNGTLCDIFKHRHHRKAFFTCCGINAMQVLSGYNIVTINCESIFIDAESPLDPGIAPIVLAVVQMVIFFVNPFIINSLGRKKALMISGVGMGVTFFSLGIFFYIQAYGDVSAVLWLPIPILILHKSLYATGFGHVPVILLSEVPATNIKGTVSSITVTLNWFLTFFVIRFYPNLANVGLYCPFWLYSGMCGLAIVFVHFYVIETKGLSLEEIQEKLKKS